MSRRQSDPMRWMKWAFGGRRMLAVSAAGSAALIGGLGLSSTAAAASRPGCATVHVGPQLTPGAAPASYFKLTVTRGARARAGVILANPEPYVCTVALFRAYGKTALNSGDTYPIPSSPLRGCARTSCWLSDLPPTVTVPAKRRVVVTFTVTVPPGTRSGQYLAGVVAGPADPPRPLRLSGRHAAVGASVVAHVALGVAITVPGPLSPELTIPSVKLNATTTSAVLSISEHNGGNTWEHPHGHVLIATRVPVRSLSSAAHGTARFVTMPLESGFGVRSQTILGGDSATLPLAIAAVPHGTWPTEVKLWYDHDRKVAIWRGQVSYPLSVSRSTGSSVPVFGDAPGSTVALPLWAKLLIGLLAGVSSALAALLLILFARRRRRRDT